LTGESTRSRSFLDSPVKPANDAELNLRGRPGWHIECSAMSVKNLGQPFDIHTGGIDLIFPHHENEIAQSTAGDQPETMAQFFVHNEHLLVDGKKMAKSAHNFYTLPDITKRDFDPLDFRMLTLQSHYRSATNFSWENLEAAQNRRRNWRNIAELRWQIADADDDGQTEIVNNLLDQATAALTDDLDTPNALAKLDLAFDQFSPEHTTLFALENLLNFVDQNLGLKLRETTPDISAETKSLLKKRQAARTKKDFAKSDELRNKLVGWGITAKDSTVGQIWSRE
jgi:cysteinyl-tRNA synthetase